MKMYSFHRFKKVFQIIFNGSPSDRRRLKQEVARICASTLGNFYLGEDQKIWLKDTEFLTIFKSLSPHNNYSMERKWTLKEFVRWTRNLEGDIAECGCHVGISAWFMANESPPDINIFLFDSFEGLSEPSQEDSVSSISIQQWKKGDLSVTQEELRNNLSEFHNIHVLKGWIPDRFSEVSSNKFRLVHIDVDLYEPTRLSLEFFYPRLVPTGIIILDDYGFHTCPGAYRAANDYAASVGEEIIHLPTGQGVIIRRM